MGWLEMETKKCPKCKMNLPKTLEYFSKRSDRENQFHSWCRKCELIQKKEYRKNNREKIRESKRNYERRRRKVNGKQVNLYISLHRRIRKHKPKQKYCTICNEEKRLELANISGNYKNDIDDFVWLCNECHYLFDKINQTHIDCPMFGGD